MNRDRLTCRDAAWSGEGRGEIRQAIERALRAWPNVSGAEIARRVTCTQQYAARVRAQLADIWHLPTRVVGKDYKLYPARRPEGRRGRSGPPRSAAGNGPR